MAAIQVPSSKEAKSLKLIAVSSVQPATIPHLNTTVAGLAWGLKPFATKETEVAKVTS